MKSTKPNMKYDLVTTKIQKEAYAEFSIFFQLYHKKSYNYCFDYVSKMYGPEA